MIIVITGANGFLGSHILDQSVVLGHQSIGLVRPYSSTQNIKDHNEIITTDYTQESLIQVLSDIKSKCGTIDLFIHNAGATRTKNNRGFDQINVGLTNQLLKVLKKEKSLGVTGKFIYVSSMASKGPVGAGGPVSAYGKSKLEAEKIVATSNFPFNIFRPTAIYGPRDVQFLRLIRAVKKGIYPSVAPRQKMTLIHASDAASNIIFCSSFLHNKTIPLDDGHVYSHQQLKTAIEKSLNKQSFTLRIPKALAVSFIWLQEKTSQLFQKNSSMTVEKFLEITRDWDHDHHSQHDEFRLKMRFDLESGWGDTVSYYQKKEMI